MYQTRDNFVKLINNFYLDAHTLTKEFIEKEFPHMKIEIAETQIENSIDLTELELPQQSLSTKKLLQRETSEKLLFVNPKNIFGKRMSVK